MSQTGALMLTLMLEAPIVLVACRVWRISPGRSVVAALLPSMLTHPLAWRVALSLSPEDYRWGWYAIEGGVCLFEAGVLAAVTRVAPARACFLSLLANGFSAITGRWL